MYGFFMSCNLSFAETATDQMNVSANVTNTCVASAERMDFGKYNTQAALYEQIVISVQCTQGLNFTIATDDSDTEYTMRQGENNLYYKLYEDPTHKVPLGGLSVIHGVSTGRTQKVLIYAEIPKGQNVPNGNYNDYIHIIFSTIDFSGNGNDSEYQVYLNIPVNTRKL